VRRALSFRSTAVAFTAAAAVLGACQYDESILLVQVSGDLTLTPSQLVVTVTAAGVTHEPLRVPPSLTTIYLPTSFTVELDRGITGPVRITIDALDMYGYILASGTTTQTYIATGGQTIIVVNLVTP
jgi:hypothetical protein